MIPATSRNITDFGTLAALPKGHESGKFWGARIDWFEGPMKRPK